MVIALQQDGEAEKLFLRRYWRIMVDDVRTGMTASKQRPRT
jgi:hypothetical protein